MLARCQQHYSQAFWDTSKASPGSFPSAWKYTHCILWILKRWRLYKQRRKLGLRGLKYWLSCGIHPHLLFKWPVAWLKMGTYQNNLLLFTKSSLMLPGWCVSLSLRHFFIPPLCTVSEMQFKLWEKTKQKKQQPKNVPKRTQYGAPCFTLHQH